MAEFHQDGLFEYPKEADRNRAHRELKKDHQNPTTGQGAVTPVEDEVAEELTPAERAKALVDRHVAAGQAEQAAQNAWPSKVRIDQTSNSLTGSTVEAEEAIRAARAQIADAHDSAKVASMKDEAEARRAVIRRARERGDLPPIDPLGLSPQGRANLNADAAISERNRKEEEMYRRMGQSSSEAQEPEVGPDD